MPDFLNSSYKKIKVQNIFYKNLSSSNQDDFFGLKTGTCINSYECGK